MTYTAGAACGRNICLRPTSTRRACITGRAGLDRDGGVRVGIGIRGSRASRSFRVVDFSTTRLAGVSIHRWWPIARRLWWRADITRLMEPAQLRSDSRIPGPCGAEFQRRKHGWYPHRRKYGWIPWWRFWRRRASLRVAHQAGGAPAERAFVLQMNCHESPVFTSDEFRPLGNWRRRVWIRRRGSCRHPRRKKNDAGRRGSSASWLGRSCLFSLDSSTV